jgi:hypothetical protein
MQGADTKSRVMGGGLKRMRLHKQRENWLGKDVAVYSPIVSLRDILALFI